MEKLTYDFLTKSNPELFEVTNVPLKIVTHVDEIAKWQEQRIAQLQNQDRPEYWAEIGVILDDPYISVIRDLVEFPDGFRNGYLRIYNKAYLERGAAGVVALPEIDGKLLLIHLYRHATRSWHWEVPRGFGEAGVKAQKQVIAEIAQEIGGEVDISNPEAITPLGLLFNNTGLEGNPIHLFYVKLKSIGELETSAGIDQYRLVSVKEMEVMIASEEITDGFTIAAYTRAKLKGLI